MTGHYHWIVLFFAMKKSLAGEQDSFSKKEVCYKDGEDYSKKGWSLLCLKYNIYIWQRKG